MIARLQALQNSVRGRLSCLVLAIAIPAAVLVAALAYQAYRNQRDAVSQHMLATARAMAATLDARIGENQALLVGLASSPALARGDIATFAEAVRALNLGPNRWIVLADANGQQLVNGRLSGDLPRNVYVAEHEQALAAGRSYISNIIVGQGGGPIMFVSVPVSVRGTHTYTLSYLMDPAALADLDPIRRNSTGTVVAVLDRLGTVAARIPNGERFVGQKAMPNVVNAAISGFEGIQESTTLEGYRVLAIVSSAPRSGWSVAIGAPYAEVFAPAWHILIMGLAIALLLLGVAIGMAVWIGRGVVTGIDALVTDTEAIGRGELPPSRSSGLVETDFVAQAMRKTAQQLQERDRENAALYDLVERVNRAAELGEIYAAALDAVVHGYGADRAAVLLCDDSGKMTFRAARGLSAFYRRAVESTLPTVVQDISLTPEFFDDVTASALSPQLRNALTAEGIRALALVPLTANRRLLGRLVLYYNQPHRFTPAGLKPIETLASQVAFALERQMAADRLEALIDERTASLRQAVAQMEEFSYSVSHDLRAPLRAIYSYAEVLLEDHASGWAEEPRDLLGRIQRCSRRMDRMVQDLLNYSRVARRDVELERVSLSKLFTELREQYAEFGPDRVDIEVPSELPDVLACEPLVVQAISNLLANAVKFVAAGVRPRIRVAADVGDGRVRLWLRDNGIGIPPELQPRLFQMFERVHSDARYEGTGIGLAIVRKAVERMNGLVGVESDGMSGSSFWLELPLVEPTPSAEQREATASTVISAPPNVHEAAAG